ncbi:hypothetical protein SDC9_123475 [bioreactor metagenome]|uniref:Uncharacterized protein n=1 Tax=bioreactor metagenome TaxID=1076179 RepID=A0A645CHQ0_9ZZZZ
MGLNLLLVEVDNLREAGGVFQTLSPIVNHEVLGINHTALDMICGTVIVRLTEHDTTHRERDQKTIKLFFPILHFLGELPRHVCRDLLSKSSLLSSRIRADHSGLINLTIRGD